MDKKTFNITGMTCAACSARIEKAVSKMEGVKKADVNLLANSMTVIFDEMFASQEKIIKKVEETGYGIAPQNIKAAPAAAARAETETLKKRLLISLVFAIPLFYLSMGAMAGLPLTGFFKSGQNALLFAFIQFALVLPIIIVNRGYFKTGFKNLAKLYPNMDSLIAIGAGAAAVYGTYSLYNIARGFTANLYFESAGIILTLITLGKYLESGAKAKTSDAVTKLINLSPKTALILRGGKEEEIPVEDVSQGDILIVKAGDIVPVDGIVEEGEASVDESAITGESIPADKTKGGKVTGGTVSKSGYFKMRACAVGADTALARIIRLVEEASSSKAPAAALADKISSVFVPVVIVISFCVFAFWLLRGQGFEFALSAGISVLIISCPCALGLATPAAIMTGIGRGASYGILIKSAQALEAAGAADTVVLDKTGTVTEGKPEVTDIFPAGNEKELLSAAASLEKMSNHPLAEAIVKYALSKEIAPKQISDYVFIPGRGVRGIIEGGFAAAGNRKMMEEAGIDIKDYIQKEERLACEGKVPLYFAEGKNILGIIALADILKPGSANAVREFKKIGLDIIMLTGDNFTTAQYIGKKAGIDKVIAGLLPQDKEAQIRALQKSGKKTVMIGDGINDAPALTAADAGIAIGAGTDIAVESAGIVLMRSDLNDAVKAVKLSRAVSRNIRQNLFWAFIYNIIGIPVAAGLLYDSFHILLNPMIAAAAMSFSSVSVVSNALRLRFFNPEKQ